MDFARLRFSDFFNGKIKHCKIYIKYIEKNKYIW